MTTKYKLVDVEKLTALLDNLEIKDYCDVHIADLSAITALLEASPAQESEPVAQISADKDCFKYVEWLIDNPMQRFSSGTKFYTHPPADKDADQLIYEFAGFLTTRKERLICSSTDNASPMVEAIKEFLEIRSKRDEAMKG